MLIAHVDQPMPRYCLHLGKWRSKGDPVLTACVNQAMMTVKESVVIGADLRHEGSLQSQ